MIQQETVLKVTDNSGAKTVKCIKVLGGFKRKYAQAGNIIVVCVKTIKSFSRVKKGDIYKAIIFRTKKNIAEKDGCYTKLFENSVSLINKKKTRSISPIASRIFGPISKKLAIKFPEFSKISTSGEFYE